MELFILFKDEAPGRDTEVEFTGDNQRLTVKPVHWNEWTLCVSAPGEHQDMKQMNHVLNYQSKNEKRNTHTHTHTSPPYKSVAFVMFSITDFPAGRVAVIVYSHGVPLSKAFLQYYNMDEISNLLSRVEDPVHFMCQVKLWP